MDKLLYNKDVLVAEIDGLNHFHWICKRRAPLYLQNYRKSFRLAAEQMRGFPKAQCKIAKEGTWTFRNERGRTRSGSERGNDNRYILDQEGRFWVDMGTGGFFQKAAFSGLALAGGNSHYRAAEKAKAKKTPELTNTGSFEKCWRMKKGEWWLCKEGNSNELFSELFAYKLGQSLGFNMAEYTLGGYIKPGTRCILSRDFTYGHKYNFEPIAALVGSRPEDYQRTYQKIHAISPDAASDYVSLLFMDALIFNTDRHEYNFGLLTNPDTGEIVGLAPNFDNNVALISNGYQPSPERQADDLIKDFNELLDSGVEWRGYSERKELPKIDERMIKDVIKEVRMKVKETFITEFIMSSYRAMGWGKSNAVF